MSNQSVVAAYCENDLAGQPPALIYPQHAPFDPDTVYPDNPFPYLVSTTKNNVYGAVRDVLHLLGMDQNHFDTPEWNPFKDLVQPGGIVVIKPNWVRHFHLRGENPFSLITHPSILRPLVDYAFKAVGKNGEIRILDAPLFDADFNALSKLCELEKFQQIMQERGIPLRIADMRSLIVQTDKGVVVQRDYPKSWANESIQFDLGSESAFYDLGNTLQNVFGSDYDRRITGQHHTITQNDQQIHEYKISKRVLEADLIISVPKLKTHKKTGVSLNIKNMIGINTDKNYIPHYRTGAPGDGGDEFPDTADKLKRVRRNFVRKSIDLVLGRSGRIGEKAVHSFMTVWLAVNQDKMERQLGTKMDPIDVFYRSFQGDQYRTGNWWGNDTCWRPGVDINRILLYGLIGQDGRGYLATQQARKYFSLVDGIIGGEGDGPLAPTPRNAGVLVAGFDPLSVDYVATQIMGFDPNIIRDINYLLSHLAFLDIVFDGPPLILSNHPDWQGEIKPGTALNFQPHPGWEEYFMKNKTI